MFEKREKLKQDVQEKYDLHSITWQELIALFLAKLTLTKLSWKRTVTFLLLLVLLISYFTVNAYFRMNTQVVTIPGQFTQASVLSKYDYDEDPINLLSVRNFTLDSLPKYIALRVLYSDYTDYIDVVRPTERNQQTLIPLGSSLYEMQMSAYLAVHNYIGAPKEYTSKLIVTEVTSGGGVAPNILPNDQIVSIDSRVITDVKDIDIAKLNYKQRQIKVLRDGKPLVFTSSLYGVEVKKVLTLQNQEDYADFVDFAEFELKGYQGRSAGVSLALSYYNSKVEEVANGRSIALTGTINEYGNVGAISGVRQKTVLAIQNGVDILFVPTDTETTKNYSEALYVIQDTGAKIQLVGVNNFTDIISYLKR